MDKRITPFLRIFFVLMIGLRCQPSAAQTEGLYKVDTLFVNNKPFCIFSTLSKSPIGIISITVQPMHSQKKRIEIKRVWGNYAGKSTFLMEFSIHDFDVVFSMPENEYNDTVISTYSLVNDTGINIEGLNLLLQKLNLKTVTIPAKLRNPNRNLVDRNTKARVYFIGNAIYQDSILIAKFSKTIVKDKYTKSLSETVEFYLPDGQMLVLADNWRKPNIWYIQSWKSDIKAELLVNKDKGINELIIWLIANKNI